MARSSFVTGSSRCAGACVGFASQSATVKLFVTASVEARALRRVKELRDQGAAAIYENALQDLKTRDARDSGRTAAPLAAAPDARVIDTTMLDAGLVFERACELVARTLEEK